MLAVFFPNMLHAEMDSPYQSSSQGHDCYQRRKEQIAMPDMSMARRDVLASIDKEEYSKNEAARTEC